MCRGAACPERCRFATTATATATGRIYDAIWYAREVKRAVKSIDEIYDSNGIRSERTTAELESCKVAN